MLSSQKMSKRKPKGSEDPMKRFRQNVSPKYKPNDLERLGKTDLKRTLRKKVKIPK